MTRTLAHVLNTIAGQNNWQFQLWSAYDSADDLMPGYLPAENFRGFGINRIGFVFKTITSAQKPDIIIVSHINLAIVGIITKLINPRCKIWLIAHGIEIWRPVSLTKRLFLKRCNKVISVSNFTKQQVVTIHKIDPAICSVLNNTVDPFINLPETFSKPAELLKRYGLCGNYPIIFTLTRLASTEQYKGHDQVIKVISRLKHKFPGINYILSGQYDDKEKIRIQKLISDCDVAGQTILTGFLAEEELADHFLLADLFVLPSKKEGFGIVFIEALACGLPVICGNADGSVDAICNGELGKAIDVEDLDALEEAVCELLKTPLTVSHRQNLQHRCLQHFNKTDYMKKLEIMLSDEFTQ